MSTNKTIVLITGANGGIGFETAKAIAASSPAYHSIIGSRSMEKGQKALSDIQSQKIKGSLSVVQLDVADQKSVSDAFTKVEKDFGRLDILINNAGIVSRAKPLINELRESFETNTFGPAVVTETFLPLLEKGKNVRLIHVSSGLGSLGDRIDESSPYYKIEATVYRMTKAALNMLALCHQVELKEKGIKVFAFDPGYVVTNLTGEADRENRVKRGAGDPAESAQALLNIIEGGRDMDEGKFLYKDGHYPW